jgi:hypothetical protein
MKQLVIKQENIYKVGDIEYFKFEYHNKVVRDVYIDISKNNKYILEYIANKCEFDYKKLNKKQLAEMIEKSGCLVLGNNNNNHIVITSPYNSDSDTDDENN